MGKKGMLFEVHLMLSSSNMVNFSIWNQMPWWPPLKWVVIKNYIKYDSCWSSCHFKQASTRITGVSIVLLGLASLFSDVAFYWVALIFFLQRGPIAPLSEEITDPDDKYVGLGILVLFLGLLVCLPFPFPFTEEAITNF